MSLPVVAASVSGALTNATDGVVTLGSGGGPAGVQSALSISIGFDVEFVWPEILHDRGQRARGARDVAGQRVLHLVRLAVRAQADHPRMS